MHLPQDAVSNIWIRGRNCKWKSCVDTYQIHFAVVACQKKAFLKTGIVIRPGVPNINTGHVNDIIVFDPNRCPLAILSRRPEAADYVDNSLLMGTPPTVPGSLSR